VVACRFAKSGHTEIFIQNSRFIASGSPVHHADEAQTFLREIQHTYPDANHHCYAFKVSGPPAVDRFSDDGEPTGTAGRPILNILEHHLQNSIIVVTRYFGGIKLGKGGLVRAYTQASQGLLEVLALCDDEPIRSLRLNYPYTLSSQLDYYYRQWELVPECQYAEAIVATLVLPQSRWAQIQPLLTELELQGLRITLD
jgi:uncharacterized YigZ family protein